ncbi:hypothetical protein HK096_007296 [Nowakowskiella sp. JEL0078]|nr:hypothetical protein HK096_007296 [Nowakowskiella sp. JEL0078]
MESFTEAKSPKKSLQFEYENSNPPISCESEDVPNFNRLTLIELDTDLLNVNENIKLQSIERTPSAVDESSIYVHESEILSEKVNAPYLPLWTLFCRFLIFGINAWGGPVAQIALVKESLVDREQWISKSTWTRAFAVYQILPGPEAVELCCYYGFLSRGRSGAFVAGIAFSIPGFIFMLLFSFLYGIIGDNQYFLASFKALQPVVAAMVSKIVHGLGEHALINPKTKKLDKLLFILTILSALNSAIHVNYFITLGAFGTIVAIYRRKRKIIACIILFIGYSSLIVYIAFKGLPSNTALGLGIAQTPGLLQLFLLGLMGGLLSFGGAYTAIPFFLQEASVIGGWITQNKILTGVALSNVSPGPLVFFSTFVGYIGGGIGRQESGMRPLPIILSEKILISKIKQIKFYFISLGRF